MRTVTITRTIYTVEELQTERPAAFQSALNHHQAVVHDLYDSSDDWASLEAIDKFVGFERHHSWDNEGEHLKFEGKRAWAWLENSLLGPHRIPWRPYVQGWGELGKVRTKYEGGSRFYRCGQVPPCPFTGYYLDDTLIEAIKDRLRAGFTVGAALVALENVVSREIDEQLSYLGSEEGFIEDALNNELEFYEDGTIV